ncbi:MAG: response regulator transcription factor [Saprospiraceae bacterium]|nr:response regulator transcription factor [Saprospiraceae bacterium]
MINNVLNFLIVEDDISSAIDLKMNIIELGYQVCGIVDNANDAIIHINNYKPDIIMMDIDINGEMNGIQLAAKIEPLDIPILYVTSFADNEHFSKANENKNAGYLTKPINKYTLSTALNYIIEKYFGLNVASNKNLANLFKGNLFFKVKDMYQKVHIDEIIMIVADNNYTTVLLENEMKILCRLSITNWEEEVSSLKFIRVHRGYIIKLDAVKYIDFKSNVIISTHGDVPIGRSYKEQIQSIFKFIK